MMYFFILLALGIFWYFPRLARLLVALAFCGVVGVGTVGGYQLWQQRHHTPDVNCMPLRPVESLSLEEARAELAYLQAMPAAPDAISATPTHSQEVPLSIPSWLMLIIGVLIGFFGHWLFETPQGRPVPLEPPTTRRC